MPTPSVVRRLRRALRIPAKIVREIHYTIPSVVVNNTPFVVSLAHSIAAHSMLLPMPLLPPLLPYVIYICCECVLACVLCFRTNTLKMGVRRGYNKHNTSHHMYHTYIHPYMQTLTHSHSVQTIVYVPCIHLFVSCVHKNRPYSNGNLKREKKENSCFGCTIDAR